MLPDDGDEVVCHLLEIVIDDRMPAMIPPAAHLYPCLSEPPHELLVARAVPAGIAPQARLELFERRRADEYRARFLEVRSERRDAGQGDEGKRNIPAIPYILESKPFSAVIIHAAERLVTLEKIMPIDHVLERHGIVKMVMLAVLFAWSHRPARRSDDSRNTPALPHDRFRSSRFAATGRRSGHDDRLFNRVHNFLSFR